MAGKFTQSDVDKELTAARRPPAGKCREIATGGNLALLVYAHGPGKWRWAYRPRGVDPETGRRYPNRKVSLGSTETHALREARQRAAALRLRVAGGEDPAVEDRLAAIGHRTAAAQKLREAVLAAAAVITCRTALEDYTAVLKARGRSVKHVQEELKQVRLALMGGLMDTEPSAITTQHVERIMAICPPGSRWARFGALDRFLRHALRRSGETAPTAALDRHERPRPVPRRSRVLSSPEIKAVWDATGTLKQDVLIGLTRFLIAVPCRESEAAKMVWHDVDLANRIWHQPTSKNTLPHRFWLNDRAAAIIEARRSAVDGDALHGDALVFPAPRNEGPFASWSRLKRTLDERLGDRVQHWRFHDLRRSCATTLGELGFDANLIDLLLNHRAAATRGGIAGVYNTAQRWAERTKAMAAWGREIDRALGEVVSDETDDTAVVVPFARSVA
jgi:integrase